MNPALRSVKVRAMSEALAGHPERRFSWHRLTDERVLLGTFVVYLLLCMGLLLYLRHMAVESIRTPAVARATSDAKVLMMEPRGGLNRTRAGLARWLDEGPYDDTFEERAASLRAQPPVVIEMNFRAPEGHRTKG